MNAPIILPLLQARHRGLLEDTVRQCLERRQQYQRVRLRLAAVEGEHAPSYRQHPAQGNTRYGVKCWVLHALVRQHIPLLLFSRRCGVEQRSSRTVSGSEWQLLRVPTRCALG